VNRNKKKNVLKKIVENTSQYYKKSFYIHDRCPLPKIFQLNVIYISYSVLNLNVLDAATNVTPCVSVIVREAGQLLFVAVRR
jgi:hypothetical protein